MKQKLLVVLAGISLAPAAFAQPSDIWENWGQIIAPSSTYPFAPQIDAVTFINHRGATFEITGDAVFDTSDTLNYTNQGIMTGFPGFDFQTYPSGAGVPRMAANFANLVSGSSGGVINCNGTFTFGGVAGLFFGNLAGNAKMLVRATNIVNTGNINLSASTLLKFTGKKVDMSRGGVNMANTFSTSIFGTNIFINGINLLFNSGILDGYWAAETATNSFIPSAFNAAFPFAPTHWVTNRQYQMLQPFVFGQVAYVNDSGVVGSNRFVQAVFLENTDPTFVNSVFFTPTEIAVQWQWTTPDWPAQTVTTNYLYLRDNFGEVTNIGIALDGFINPQALYPTPTYKPINYTFTQGSPYTAFNPGAQPAPPGSTGNVFDRTPQTNQYAAYEGIFSAATQLQTDIVGGAPSNMMGRVEISADSTLNLNSSRITTLNYLRLEATNHFLGSQDAMITTPFADYNLRSTNGQLTITNLIAPFVPHPEGTCELWSGRWTNVVSGITNSFHVLFVDSFLQPVTLAQIANLKLAVTNSPASAPRNLLINDMLNITTSMQLNSERITIGANDPNAFTSAGQLNLLTGGVVWSSATPGLQYLTNYGGIRMQNAVYFGGSRTQPPYNTNIVDIPYQAFVNAGGVTNQGSLIWSTYFENTGTFEAGQGSIILQQCSRAVLHDGLFDAPNGQVGLTAGSLLVSNYVIQSAGALDLSVTNSVDDGGAGNGNIWTAEDGFSLHVKPATGDLLGTTVFNTSPDFAETINTWAGQDRGRSAAGYSNNCAVGQLKLFGGTNSAFRFVGTGAANALYVDLLTLDGSVTNRDGSGNFPGLDIDSNMKVYFADAVLPDGRSIAEKLDGKNGGRLVWVSSYAGIFSSTNLLYPNGITYTFNRALVDSCTIDSDGDGIVNCNDPTPIFVPGVVQVSISRVSQPAGAKLLSWSTIANSTNSLFYKTTSASTNWLMLTNYVFGPVSGRATVLDTSSATTRYYRVRVDPHQP